MKNIKLNFQILLLGDNIAGFLDENTIGFLAEVLIGFFGERQVVFFPAHHALRLICENIGIVLPPDSDDRVGAQIPLFNSVRGELLYIVR